MTNPILTTIFRASALAGTLDILSAFVFANASPATVLRAVAAGPFGDVMHGGGAVAAMLGLGVHFTIMTTMTAAYVVTAHRLPVLIERPWLSGASFGLLIYALMYWLVLPLRWPAQFPMTDSWSVGNAIFSHIVCVGWPIALITAATFGRRPATLA